MSRFIAGIKWQPVVVIDVAKRRPSADAVAMAIALGVLAVWVAIAVVRIFYPEVFNVSQP